MLEWEQTSTHTQRARCKQNPPGEPWLLQEILTEPVIPLAHNLPDFLLKSTDEEYRSEES